MLSRVAENVYWIGRYVERAESVARLLIDASQLELDDSGAPRRPLRGVLAILGCETRFASRFPDGAGSVVAHYLTLGRSNGASVADMIGRARENGRGAQEVIGGEAWAQLNQLHLFLAGRRARERFHSAAFRFYQRVARDCTLFAAVVDGALPRDEAYHFLVLGRHLERVEMLGRTLSARCLADAELNAGGDPLHWASLLRGCSAYEAYLRQARERIDPRGVLSFLLLEPDFPRSMAFALQRCLESLHVLAGVGATPAERQLGRLEGDLRYLDVNEVCERGVGPFLAGVLQTCARAGEEIDRAFFRH